MFNGRVTSSTITLIHQIRLVRRFARAY